MDYNTELPPVPVRGSGAPIAPNFALLRSNVVELRGILNDAVNKLNELGANTPDPTDGSGPADVPVTGARGTFDTTSRLITIAWDTPRTGTVSIQDVLDVNGLNVKTVDASAGSYTYPTPVASNITSVTYTIAGGNGAKVTIAAISTGNAPTDLQPNSAGNLLSQAQHDAGSDVTLFTLEGAGQTVESSTEWALLGSSSMKVTTTSLASVTVNSGPRPIPVGATVMQFSVTPGTTYSTSVTVRNKSVDPASQFQIAIKWRDSAGAPLSSTNGDPFTIQQGASVVVSTVAKAPANAVYAYPILHSAGFTPATNAVYYFDGWEFLIAPAVVIVADKPANNLLTQTQYDAGTDLTKFTTEGVGATLSASTDWATLGASSVRVSFSGANLAAAVRTAGTVAVTAGTIYTAAVDVKNEYAASQTFHLTIRWVNGSNTVLSTSDTTLAIAANGEAVLSLTGVAPAGATGAYIVVRSDATPFIDGSSLSTDRWQLTYGQVTARALAGNWRVQSGKILNPAGVEQRLLGANIGVNPSIGGNVYSDESTAPHTTEAIAWGWNIVRITTYACREVSWIGSGNGKFQANTAYRADIDRIYQSGKQYRPKVDFTSGTTFDAADWTAGSTSTLYGRDTAIAKTFAAADKYLAAGFIVILAEMSITSGVQARTNTKLDDIEDFFQRAATRYANEPRVWLNVNEPAMASTAANFQSFYERFYAAARTGGNNNIFVIDILGNAQDPIWSTGPKAYDDTVGPAFLANGNKTNVVFSHHAYGGQANNADTQDVFNTKYAAWVNNMKAKNLPVIFGEAGYTIDALQKTATGDTLRNIKSNRAVQKLSLEQNIGAIVWDGTFDKFGLKATLGSGGNHSQAFWFSSPSAALAPMGKEWWDLGHQSATPITS